MRNSAQINWITLKGYLQELEMMYSGNMLTGKSNQKDREQQESYVKIEDLLGVSTISIPILEK